MVQKIQNIESEIPEVIYQEKPLFPNLMEVV